MNELINVTDTSGNIRIGPWDTNGINSQSFDFSKWIEEYGEGELIVLHQRAGDDIPYVVSNVDINEGIVKWTFSEIDSASVGFGRASLVYKVGNRILARTLPYNTLTCSTLGESGIDVPDPWDEWYNKVLQASLDAQLAADNADLSAEESEAWAVGTKNSVPVSSDDPTYENNSKYYSIKSESYAVGGTGTRTGEDTDNSKYYSEQSSNSANDANNNSLKSEGFAIGEQSGFPVTSESPYYNNNSKFYCIESKRYYDALNELRNAIYSSYILKSISGSILSINDGADNILVKSLLFKNTVEKINFNQLIQNGDFSFGIESDYWRANTDSGTIQIRDGYLEYYITSVSGSSIYNRVMNIFGRNVGGWKLHHKYYCRFDVLSTRSGVQVRGGRSGSATDCISINTISEEFVTANGIFEVTNENVDANFQFWLRVENGQVGDVFQFKNVMLFDLTTMYGAGNEPVTTEEVLSDFPNEYYNYTTGTVIYFGTLPNQLSVTKEPDTVNFNQLVYNGNMTSASNWDAENGAAIETDGVLTYTIDTVDSTNYGNTVNNYFGINPGWINDHKYYLRFDVKSSRAGAEIWGTRVNSSDGVTVICTNEEQWYTAKRIFACTESTNVMYSLWMRYYNAPSNAQVNDTLQFRNVALCDLTEIYGVGNEPATIEEFEANFPFGDNYYPRNVSKKMSRLYGQTYYGDYISYVYSIEVPEGINETDEIEWDVKNGIIHDITSGDTYAVDKKEFTTYLGINNIYSNMDRNVELDMVYRLDPTIAYNSIQ